MKTVWNTLFRLTPNAEARTVDGLLQTIGLGTKADIPAALLSHGEKQWLEIGMLVAQSPDLLLVTVLREDSVLCEGTMNEIQSDPRVIKVYLGDPDAM